MRQGVYTFCLVCLIAGLAAFRATADEAAPVSQESKSCITCHTLVSPGIVFDWQSSRHAQTTPSEAVAKDPITRRISVGSVSDLSGKDVAVGCYECHTLRTDRHRDSFLHYGQKVNVVVSPADCATCHPVETDQYSSSKKANAHLILKNNPLYATLMSSINSVKRLTDRPSLKLHFERVSDNTNNETCYACHGTEITVEGMREIESKLGKLQVPILKNWPNQGVGRINPDGSLGACTSCHPRHTMSIEVARKPATCGQCHLEPDTPAYNIYKESKHGNIYESLKSKWNWNSVPWKVGEDFAAPTCATCHNSLVTDPRGNIIAERSHDFASRLWVRIFGLIYSHAQPKNGGTFNIVNDDGQPLPTTFAGRPASRFLIDPKEQQARKDKMTSVCSSCHGSQLVNGYLERFENTVDEADAMTLAATEILGEAWKRGIEDKTNPFDELVEMHWVRQWMFYANSVRYGSAMMGPDYGWSDIWLGRAYARLDQYEEAEAAYAESVRREPEFVQGYISLGDLSVRKDRTQQAQSYYEKVLEIDPFHDATKKKLDKLNAR